MIPFVAHYSSCYLWSISLPGKNGTPNSNLRQDKEAQVANTCKFTLVQLAHERVITKVFNHYAIPLEISDTIRAAFKAKLWRMGKLFSKLGGTKCQEQLIKWKDGSEATWNFVVNEVEVQRQLLKRKRSIEEQIEKESTKRRKLENEVKVLRKTAKKQAKVIARLRTGRLENSRGSSSKSWLQYSRQQRYNKKKDLAKNIQSALSFCEDEGFKPCSVEVENVDTGSHELLNVACGTY